jgi:hypothetical protein
MVEYFEGVVNLLKDPAILPQNCYDMDETGILLSMLGSVKLLVDKDEKRDYTGVGVN